MGKIKTDAKVLRVIDGDTLEVSVKIRISKIDAPETKGIEKPLGIVTKEWLQERIGGKTISLEIVASDYYRRLLADVYQMGSNVAEEMLDKKLVEVYAPSKHNDGKLEV
jgi:endonuclease YncB( thermonuclease family)